MDYIKMMKERNIQFNLVEEFEAERIFRVEYSYYKLLEYSPLFPRYNGDREINKFVKLDFLQLYYIAKIDEKFSHITMLACLDIEQALKTIILFDMDKNDIKQQVLDDFLAFDREYILSTYTPDNFQIISEKYMSNNILSLELEQVIDIFQFGSLIRFFDFIKENYSDFVELKKYELIGKHLNSAKNIRNIVAHNNSLISQLNIRHELKTDIVSSFIGQNGVKNKTLRTNMSKKIVFDFCHLLHLYYLIVPKEKILQMQKEIQKFFNIIDENYSSILKDNQTLHSVYNFLQMVTNVYEKFFEKSIDN